MFYKIETSDGNISIERVVIGKIICEIINQFNGKVQLSNHRGKGRGFVAKIGGIDDTNYIELEMGPNGLEIKLYLVIRFGTSIKMVTRKIMEDMKKYIEEYLDIKVNSVSIVVVGMVSKQFARRHIEIKG